MIHVKNVSMKFNLGIDKGYSIKLLFISLFNKKYRREKYIIKSCKWRYETNNW